MSSNTGVYVPPHLRNRPTQPIAGPSRITNRGSLPAGPSNYASPSKANHSLPNKRWNDPSTSTIRPPQTEPYDPSPQPYPNSAPSPRRPATAGSPTLYVYGDSFTGPLKLLAEDNVKVFSYKGASAKGLNNPNSIKQVSRDLLPSLNSIMAPPPYVYVPSAGRWALLIFGNVDLQINYLWQLQHKPISAASFPSLKARTSDEDVPMDEDPHAFNPNVLASATETSLTGPALGPDLFVERVFKGYTAWLEREIVNGPTGKRLRERAADTSSIRRKAPGKVLVAAALPPLVDDETLPRIPEKYVDRLEEDHAKTQRALERENRADRIEAPIMETEESHSKTPWALSRPETPLTTTTMILDGAGPPSPKSSTSSSSFSEATSQPPSSTSTGRTTPPPSASSPTKSSFAPVTLMNAQKKTIESLLQHDPPLCNLSTRIYMTNKYNNLLRAYCEERSDVLGFVDITPGILAGNISEPDSTEILLDGQADRTSWACPVDPTNIHPLWEPTLPLWKDELGRHGVPTQSYSITEDAEETFKAYEVDKRRRTANGIQARIKLRDE